MIIDYILEIVFPQPQLQIMIMYWLVRHVNGQYLVDGDCLNIPGHIRAEEGGRGRQDSSCGNGTEAVRTDDSWSSWSS